MSIRLNSRIIFLTDRARSWIEPPAPDPGTTIGVIAPHLITQLGSVGKVALGERLRHQDRHAGRGLHEPEAGRRHPRPRRSSTVKVLDAWPLGRG